MSAGALSSRGLAGFTTACNAGTVQPRQHPDGIINAISFKNANAMLKKGQSALVYL